MKRKAFWGQSGRITREIPGLVYGELRDMAVSDKGIFIIDRITKVERFIPWGFLESKALPANWTVPREFQPGLKSVGLRIVPAEEEQ